jgi:hypothetical protein
MNRTAQAQRAFTRLSVALIVGSALVITYVGTMSFCQAHGAPGWRGSVIAAMNDLAVLVGVLWPERPFQVIAGFCASFTIWANVAHAAAGPAGITVALIPPFLAIALVGALELVLRRQAQLAQEAEPEPVQHVVVDQLEPEPLVQTEPEPVQMSQAPEPVQEGFRKAQAQAQRAKVQAQPRGSGVEAQGIDWAKNWEGSEWPTVKQIMAQFPDMSLSTAKRVRAADPAKSGKSDRMRETVNA